MRDKAKRFTVYRGMKKDELFAKALSLAEVADALLDYIDAIPEEMANAFPSMPGIDRDHVESVLEV